MSSREAVVTGVGVVNAIANDFDAFVEAMRVGRCGQRPITSFDAGGLRNSSACEAAEFDPYRVYEHRSDRKMDRSSELVLAAFDQAVAMARIDLKGVEPMRGAVVLGSTLGGSLTGFRYYRAVRAGRRRPSQLRDCSMHAPGYRLCIESGFLGPNLVLSTACTSSNLALTVAHDLICANKADVVIAGGFDTMSPVSCAGFSAMRNVASGVCRPFDRRRDGLVLGEGGAVLIVEADDFAARRGARALAAIRGYGIVSDAHSMTAPDPTASGPATCMRQAVDMAGLAPAGSGPDLRSRNGHGAQRPNRGQGAAQGVRPSWWRDSLCIDQVDARTHPRRSGRDERGGGDCSPAGRIHSADNPLRRAGSLRFRGLFRRRTPRCSPSRSLEHARLRRGELQHRDGVGGRLRERGRVRPTPERSRT